MRKRGWIGLALSAAVAAAAIGIAPAASAAGMLEVVSEKTVTGFPFPESVGCDSRDRVLYVSQFVSELKPTQKDGKGRISKISLDGTMLEEQVFPPAGEILDKPKGIWIEGGHLWVTDIDVVWQFDLKSGTGKKVALPGVQFANDPAVRDGVLYVSDNRGDQLFRVEPADFMHSGGAPAVSVVFKDKAVNPNGLYPARDGSLLMVGFASKEQPRPVFALGTGGGIKALSRDIGRLDGVYQMDDGSLLVTDWNSGTLFHWSEDGAMRTLASGFTGPADFCAMPDGDGLLVVVPDLVKSELRILRLAK